MAALLPANVKFTPGIIVQTPGAKDAVPYKTRLHALVRHLSGDWGDVCEEDRKCNDASLRCGERLVSSYRTDNDQKFWIITEADRSATIVLLPTEY